MTDNSSVNGTAAANLPDAGKEADIPRHGDRGDGAANGIAGGGTDSALLMEEGMSVLLDVNGEKQSFAYLGSERYE